MHELRRWINLLTEAKSASNIPAAIEATIKEFLENGTCKTVREIGDGHCRNFAWAVLTKLGITPQTEGANGSTLQQMEAALDKVRGL